MWDQGLPHGGPMPHWAPTTWVDRPIPTGTEAQDCAASTRAVSCSQRLSGEQRPWWRRERTPLPQGMMGHPFFYQLRPCHGPRVCVSSLLSSPSGNSSSCELIAGVEVGWHQRSLSSEWCFLPSTQAVSHQGYGSLCMCVHVCAWE